MSDTDISTGHLSVYRQVLEKRSAMLAAVRSFFAQRNFLETETPVRIPTPALEQHINALPSGNAWLRTSPEMHMKRLLAAGYQKIFQIGPCFRQGEYGELHNPEFTMLEWYRAHADYKDILNDAKELIAFVFKSMHPGETVLSYRGHQIDLCGDWHVQTVAQAFSKLAGWDPVKINDPDRFEDDLLNRVEPRLPLNRPTVLINYPAPMAALARTSSADPAVAERWELYIAGIEIANAFSELTDPAEQLRRFEACAALRREAGETAYEIDYDFLEALKRGLPPSGGIALGLDRLLMLLCDAASLNEILPFRCRG